MRRFGILLAVAGLAAFAGAGAAQEGPQDEAKQNVLKRIAQIERDSFKAPPEEEGDGDGRRGRRGMLWGRYNPDNVMMILPMEEKVLQGVDKLAAFVREGLWPSAARTVQQLMDNFPHRVLRLKKEPYRFLGVKSWCENLLRASPELLAAYRENTDPMVRARMKRAAEEGDFETLKELGLQYPLSGHGPELLLRLGLMFSEDGRFEEAAFFLHRMIELYPDDERVRTEALPLAAVVLARLGDIHEIRRLSRLVRKKDWGGTRVETAAGEARLGRFLDDKASEVQEFRGRDYRRMLDHFVAREGRLRKSAVSWRYPLLQGGGGRKNQKRAYILPALVGRKLMINVGYHVAAVDAKNGKLRDTPQKFAGGSGREQEFQRIWGGRFRRYGSKQEPPMSFYAVTTDGQAGYYCALHTVERPARRGRTVEVQLHTLYARDFEKGRRLFSLKDSGASILASPELVGRSLYAGFSRREDLSTPPDTFASRVDRLTGEILWKTFLCMNTGKGAPMYGPFSEAPPIVITASGGLLFCNTNNGILAAVESLTGHIRWIRTYGQKRTGLMPAPPIPFGDAVLMGGTDSKRFYSLDRQSGKVFWLRELDRDGIGSGTHLYGLSNSRIFFMGKKSIAVNAESGKLEWIARLPDEAVGKGVLTRDAIYVPTEEGIVEIDPEGGKLERIVMEWANSGKDAGNLLLVPGGFVTYTETFLNGFVSKGRSRRGY